MSVGREQPGASFSGLYAIADAGVLAARGVELRWFAEGLRAAGVPVVQWRAKGLAPAEALAGAAVLAEVFAGSGTLLVMNDRVDLALLAGFGGVHVGQGDLSIEAVRRVSSGWTHSSQKRDEWGTEDRRFVVGVSTHTAEEVLALSPRSENPDLHPSDQVRSPGTPDLHPGDQVRPPGTPDLGHLGFVVTDEPDYVAVGPVFGTATKLDAAAVVGLDGVRRARGLTRKPLVAIGGITRENCAAVRAAGADMCAVISGLLVDGESVEKVARDFMAILR